ncbi:MAG TPA: ABC transporter permease, partial [Rhodothermales bacterium]
MDYRLLIARRYLLSRKRVSLISIIAGISVAGVSLGVASLVVVLSVMNGFYDFVRDLLISLDPHVRIVSADERGIDDVDSLLSLAMSVPGVVHASPYVEGKALLLHGSGSDVNKVVIVRGVQASGWQGVSQVVERTGIGSFSLEQQEDRPGIVLGMALSRRLGLAPGPEGTGSSVGLLSAEAVEAMVTQIFGAPRVRRF